jgi:DNA polymerase IV
VEVELELLPRGEVPAHTEDRSAPDQGAFEGDLEHIADQLARLQRDEGVSPEEARAYRGPLGLAGGVVEIHLVDRSDLAAAGVERSAPDQTSRVDVGLHGSLQLVATWAPGATRAVAGPESDGLTNPLPRPRSLPPPAS